MPLSEQDEGILDETAGRLKARQTDVGSAGVVHMLTTVAAVGHSVMHVCRGSSSVRLSRLCVSPEVIYPKGRVLHMLLCLKMWQALLQNAAGPGLARETSACKCLQKLAKRLCIERVKALRDTMFSHQR